MKKNPLVPGRRGSVGEHQPMNLLKAIWLQQNVYIQRNNTKVRKYYMQERF